MAYDTTQMPVISPELLAWLHQLNPGGGPAGTAASEFQSGSSSIPQLSQLYGVSPSDIQGAMPTAYPAGTMGPDLPPDIQYPGGAGPDMPSGPSIPSVDPDSVPPMAGTSPDGAMPSGSSLPPVGPSNLAAALPDDVTAARAAMLGQGASSLPGPPPRKPAVPNMADDPRIPSVAPAQAMQTFPMPGGVTSQPMTKSDYNDMFKNVVSAYGPGGKAAFDAKYGGGTTQDGPKTASGSSKKGLGAMLSDPMTMIGLGIMGGTSPYAAVNIGQGALQGIKSKTDLDAAAGLNNYRAQLAQGQSTQNLKGGIDIAQLLAAYNVSDAKRRVAYERAYPGIDFRGQ